MNQFVFMYPIREFFAWEVNNSSHHWSREAYAAKLNDCIDGRYRQKGFGINYITFADRPIQKIIDLKESDRIFVQPDNFGQGEDFHYLNLQDLFSWLGEVDHLRVAGFHRGDCVYKTAEAAFLRGIDSLVDEDLTEAFSFVATKPGFDFYVFPGGDMAKELEFRTFIEGAEKPWLLQPEKKKA